MINSETLNTVAEEMFGSANVLNKLVLAYVCYELPPEKQSLENLFNITSKILNAVKNDVYDEIEAIFLGSKYPIIQQLYQDFCFYDYLQKEIMCWRIIYTLSQMGIKGGYLSAFPT